MCNIFEQMMQIQIHGRNLIVLLLFAALGQKEIDFTSLHSSKYS